MALPTVRGPEPAKIDWGALPRSYMNPGELEVLVALAREVQPRNVLEIGCNSGRTARMLLDHVPSIERYQGIDVLPGYQFAKPVQRREVPPKPGEHALGDPRFELVLRRRGSFDLEAGQLLAADFVFIDGDHGMAAVLRDSLMAAAILRSGGMIVWHDYHQHGTVDVAPVLEAFAAAGSPIVHIEGTWLAYARDTVPDCADPGQPAWRALRMAAP